MKHQRPNATMVVGDTFPSHNEDGEPVVVTVLEAPVTRVDIFGRPLFAIWGQRSDTGGAGELSFGWTEDLPTPARPQPTQAERDEALHEALREDTEMDAQLRDEEDTKPTPTPERT